MTLSFVRGVVAALAVSSLCGCTCSGSKEPAAGGASSAAAAASAAAPIRPEDLPENQRVPTAWPLPTGPRLEIIPGQGVGPIRIGATVETIERLMTAPCEFRTENACRYVGRAVEFFLKDGVTEEIRVYRKDRPAEPAGRTYGIFNGSTRDGPSLGMLQNAVHGLTGNPLATKAVENGGAAHTVAIDDYEGMRIEYDRLESGNVVVGCIILRKPVAKPSPQPSPKK